MSYENEKAPPPRELKGASLATHQSDESQVIRFNGEAPGEPFDSQPDTSQGFFKAWRNPAALELGAMNPNAFWLLYVIAHRANWHGGFNRHELGPGEAMLGDFKRLGMSERQYRTAKEQLEKHGFATFKATNKGTIGKLANSAVFDVFGQRGDGQNDSRATDSRRTSDGQPTTNEEVKKVRREEIKTLGNPMLPGVAEPCTAEAVPASKTVSDADWLQSLKADPAYQGVEVAREHAKMVRWCSENGRQPTRRRFINWLNRCDRPMRASGQSAAEIAEDIQPPSEL